MLLKKHGVPLKPVELLDLIYIEDDSSNEDCASIKQLTPAAREELNLLAEWMDNNLVHQYQMIYSDERSEIIFKSLMLLKDHQKSGSWGHETLKSSRYYGRTDTMKKTTSQRLQSM